MNQVLPRTLRIHFLLERPGTSGKIRNSFRRNASETLCRSIAKDKCPPLLQVHDFESGFSASYSAKEVFYTDQNFRRADGVYPVVSRMILQK